MSIEQQITELTLAINRLATSIQANTESGNRIVATLTNPEPNYVQPEQTQPVVDKDEYLTLAREQGEANATNEATNPPPAPAKRNRRTRAEIEAAKQPTPEPTPDPTIATQQELPLDAEVEFPEQALRGGTGPSLADVREAAIRYRDKHGLEKARELLVLYKVTRIGELDFNQYSDFITDASK